MSTSVHSGGEMYSVYDNLWKMMNDAQIAIYSVDLRSSTVDLPMSTGGVRPSDAGDPQFDIELQAKVQRAESNSTLKSFAENTGGKAFLGGNNLTETLRQAIQDDSNYYMLGYYVGRNSTKPGWHTLAITSSTKGARIRSRRGFLLTSDTSPASAEQDIHLALTSPLDFTGVPISITWLGKESGQVSDKSRTRFELEIPAGFASVDETDNNHMLVDIAVSAKSSNGNAAGDISQRIDTHLNSDALAQIQQHGMTYRNGLRLPPGEYTVRFVVRDSLGNRLGSVAAPVKVAADTADSTLPAH